MNKWLRVLGMVFLALTLVLSACGGGGGGGNGGDDKTGHYEGGGDDNGGYGGGADDGDSGGGGDNGGSGGGGGNVAGNFTVLAWNDLGMHCEDKDFSVFSILPPYNTLHVQVVKRSSSGIQALDLANNTEVHVYYESAPDPESGSINTISSTKTNFWDYADTLFGVSLSPDIGLTGYPTPGRTPVEITNYDSTYRYFEASGIPIVPIDDSGKHNFYPLVRVTAKDNQGNLLASTTTVLPVSDEMTCVACHGSSSGYSPAKPSSGWENDPDEELDYRWNILKKHDELEGTTLYNTAKGGSPILCASCHSSNALPGTGVSGIKPLTEAIHGMHAGVVDPQNGKTMDESTNRTSCYRCHPGQSTQCLRGAMGNSGIQCQDCHGSMSDVGSPGREGWFDMPTCQNCHYDGKRESTAFSGNSFRQVSDNRFATTPDTPVSGVSLYRFSKGHGGLQCEACHGSTHAIYPSSHSGDNLQSINLQGYAGTIRECSVCHDSVAFTTTGGPHGMHTIGQAWVNGHGEGHSGGISECAYCHGSDYRGSFLSEVKTTKTFSTKWGTRTFNKGHQVSCYDCHNGPNEGD